MTAYEMMMRSANGQAVGGPYAAYENMMRTARSGQPSTFGVTTPEYINRGTLGFGNGYGTPTQQTQTQTSAQQQREAAMALPSYAELFDQNRNMYDLTLGQYGNAYRRLDETQQAIDEMQRNMYGTVMGTLDNAGAAAGQEITDQYAAQRGNTQQSLISRGLGNTTVRDSVERGLTYDESKSRVNLANQIAAQRAGYQTHFADLGVESAQRYAQQYGGIAQAAAGYTGNYGNMLVGMANNNANNRVSNNLQEYSINSNNANAYNSLAAQRQSQQTAAQNQMQQQLLQDQLQAALQAQQGYY